MILDEFYETIRYFEIHNFVLKGKQKPLDSSKLIHVKRAIFCPECH